MKESMGLCGGFPVSTDIFFTAHCSAFFENVRVFFPNNYNPLLINSNVDLCRLETLNGYIAESLVNITE
jgi:hypothetical protein